jgi:peptidoglycan hydrolase-like protein with peptidoglycan-binding domain
VAAHSFNEAGEPDGSYGGNMTKTMKKFQGYVGLLETGELDDATRFVLNKTVITYNVELTNDLDEIQKLNGTVDK